MKNSGYLSRFYRPVREKAGVLARKAVWSLKKRTVPEGAPTLYDAPFSCIASEVRLTPSGIILELPNRVRCDLTAVHEPDLIRLPLWPGWFAAQVRKKVRMVPEATLGIHYYCGNEYNHYHFLREISPRLIHFLGEEKTRNLPVIINDNIARSTAFAEFLRVQGLDHNRFIICPPEGLHVQKLHIFHPPGLPQSKMLELAKAFHAPVVERPQRKVLLLRKSPRRPLSNREALTSALAPLGFETVFFETLTMAEQIEVAANTRFLVAEHGAGIGNFAFHGKGQLNMIELRPDYLQKLWFFKFMCEEMGWAYEVLSGKSESPDGAWQIDPEQLVATINKMNVNSAAETAE